MGELYFTLLYSGAIKMPNTFTNKEYAGILYTVSAKEILRLRFWNTLTVTHIVQHMKPCTKF